MYKLKFINFNNKKTNYSNIGDLYCSPSLYFDFKTEFTLEDFNTYVPNHNDICILGGGGMFSTWHLNHLERYLHCHKKIVWGAGINHHNTTEYNLDKNLLLFDIVGLRDDTKLHPYKFIPCVSCMNPLLSNTYEIYNDTVIYEHYDVPINLKYPKMNNQGEDIEEKIRFLGSSNNVITNTYHGLYWATLLKKKVVVYKPFSNRFLNTPFKINICDEQNYLLQLNTAPIHENLLEQYKKLNVDYYNFILNYIK